ncbi:MAG: tyrosine-type recombinase/integrase [Polyangiaceae bacterium]|nr:tyrosine-type recombinase/integrase [Polyangiaceae bacterium]
MDADGVRRSAVFETHREAAVELKRRELEAEGIRGGTIARPAEPHTFNELADYWLEQRAPGKRSRKDDVSIIRKHLRPEFGELDLDSIEVARIDAYVTTRRDLSKKTVNNHLTLLKTMLGVAVDLGWLSAAPRVRKPRVPLFQTDYRYLRTQAEIDRLLDAARLHSEQTAILYATAVYTGLRKGELARLQWSDVDFDRRLITVQRSFDGLTKAERVRCADPRSAPATTSAAAPAEEKRMGVPQRRRRTARSVEPVVRGASSCRASAGGVPPRAAARGHEALRYVP